MPDAKPVALIAGGPAAIEEALAGRLARDGHDVALCRACPPGQHGHPASQDAGQPGGRLLVHHGELAAEDEARAFVTRAEAELGPPSALVACADGGGPEAGQPDWTRELDRAYQLCRAAVMGFIRRKSGRVVIVSPPPGTQEDAGRSALEAGLRGFALALAKECGRYGVRVNAVCPGHQEADVADLVAFLVSGRADYLNGQVLRIDGGPRP